ncbi:EAL domain-containing protein [Limimonas halophila]|uniref:EAL domain-containing protein n=1 Tax=Limimonas halophila TaxID=1082479 RepID=UPI00115FD9AF|nr:EAL domain-containing protein [Limimonas halophila]
MAELSGRDPAAEVQAFVDFVGKTTRGGRPGVSVITVSVRELEPATDMAAARAELVRRLNETADTIGARLFNLNDRFLVLVPPQDELNFVNHVYQVRMRVIEVVGRQASELGLNPAEFTDVLHTKRDAQKLATLAQAAAGEPTAASSTPAGPLSQEHIESVVEHARACGPRDFVQTYGRYQALARFERDGRVRCVARELHIAMAELRARLLPGVDLMANPNLFRELTRKLDEIVLASLAESRMLQGHISVNLNIASMEEDTFERIAERVRERDNTSLWVEMDVSDVLANLARYRRIRRIMDRNRIHAIADGVNAELVAAAENAELGMTGYKFIAPRDLNDIGNLRIAAEQAVHAGKTAILSRVEDASTIEIGQRMGIGVFQGFYIDDLLRAHASAG